MPSAKTIFRSFRPGQLAETHARSRAGNSLGRSPPETTPEPTGPIARRSPDAIGIMPDVVVLLRVIGMTICLAPRGACGGGSLSFTIHLPGLRSSVHSRIPFPGKKKDDENAAGRIPGILQYLQSGRVRKNLETTAYKGLPEINRRNAGRSRGLGWRRAEDQALGTIPPICFGGPGQGNGASQTIIANHLCWPPTLGTPRQKGELHLDDGLGDSGYHADRPLCS